MGNHGPGKLTTSGLRKLIGDIVAIYEERLEGMSGNELANELGNHNPGKISDIVAMYGARLEGMSQEQLEDEWDRQAEKRLEEEEEDEEEEE